jgi:hypothetical protein
MIVVIEQKNEAWLMHAGRINRLPIMGVLERTSLAFA